ncbi:MAG: Jag N-terminal domain-containing protein [Actinomycetota bacterium]|nr:Jag N-terminal domain-containing protein [Actinomycetota bacterium]
MAEEKAREFVGRTVEEAINVALQELGMERNDVHIEVLEAPQKGFLGLGGREARIRVEPLGEWEVKAHEKPRGDKAEPAGQQKAEAGPEPGRNVAAPAQMVEKIVGFFGINAEVKVTEKESEVLVDITGDDVAILIGKGGATLDALQYLVNVVCRGKGLTDKRIIIDVSGYRRKKRKRLEAEAVEAAEKASSEKRDVEMRPMGAGERRTVHMALKARDDVTTESKGEGEERRVVIYPKEQSPT